MILLSRSARLAIAATAVLSTSAGLALSAAAQPSGESPSYVATADGNQAAPVEPAGPHSGNQAGN